jgi:hypothetical protein
MIKAKAAGVIAVGEFEAVAGTGVHIGSKDARGPFCTGSKGRCKKKQNGEDEFNHNDLKKRIWLDFLQDSAHPDLPMCAIMDCS